MHILRHYSFTLCLLLGILIGGLAGVLFGERATLVQPIGGPCTRFCVNAFSQ